MNNKKFITIYGKSREILSQDSATEKALRKKETVEFKKKVTKTHILFGFLHTFFEPVFVTDKELHELEVNVGEFGTIYAIHR